MTCEKLKKLIPDYLMGSLEPETVKQFEEHVFRCSGCGQELEQLRSVWEKLGELPQEEPEPSIRSRFYAMLEQAKTGTKAKKKVPLTERLEPWVMSWWPHRPVIQVGFAVVALIFGLLIGTRIQSGIIRNGEMAMLRQEIRGMRQMVSMSLLKETSSSERIRGVGFSTRVDQPSEPLLTALLNTLNSDPNVNVRLAAVDALIVFSNRRGVRDELIRSLSRQTSPLVQISLIDLLVQIQEKKSLDALKNLIQDQKINPVVKQRAEKGIEELI